MESLNKLKVAELKKILKEKNLSTDGNKSVLVQRIIDAGGNDLDSSEIASEHLDTDEDLILGNDESCVVDDVIEKPDTTPAASLAAVAAVPATSTSTRTLTKVSPPSQKKSDGVNGGKMEERMKRFGVVTDDNKKKSRAERFQLSAGSSGQASSSSNGVSSKESALSSVSVPNEELLKKRAERFGASASADSSTKSGTSDLLKKRAERFGASVSENTDKQTLGNGSDILSKRKARFEAVSFGEGGAEAKKKKRAERFGLMNS